MSGSPGLHCTAQPTLVFKAHVIPSCRNKNLCQGSNAHSGKNRDNK